MLSLDGRIIHLFVHSVATSPLKTLPAQLPSVFGPAGHYLGLKDWWQADCTSKDRKSFITNCKDNRFNSLFRTSIQVFCHRRHFLDLIDEVEVLLQQKRQKLSQKILALCCDLQCDILTQTQALAIIIGERTNIP